MNIRHQYAIGDLQGCYDAFLRLLNKIEFDPEQDKLWLAGDLVARGEDSLNTLRYVKKLHDIGSAETVLGNHDITLIAVWRGILSGKKKDNTAEIFSAQDCDELLHWLRRQPLLLEPDKQTILVHAGIPPHWQFHQAKKYAKEVEVQLQSSLKQLDRLLPNLYSKQADIWSEDLHGYARLRAITNYFTRMRLCKANGTLEFSFKAGLDESMPTDFQPWFSWKRKWQKEEQRKVLFGHWAALQADIDLPHAKALDSGCVWGRQLLAYRLADGKVTTVNADGD